LRKAIVVPAVLLALAGATVGAATAFTAKGTEPEIEIEIEDFAFHPARKVVGKGQLVVWKNSDQAPHNATALKKAGGKPVFRTRTATKNARLTARAPRTRGTYKYECSVHPRMRGTLIVR
jgi:plastocyanin